MQIAATLIILVNTGMFGNYLEKKYRPFLEDYRTRFLVERARSTYHSSTS